MSRVPGLDTLRAIAIVWVMLFHSYLIGGLGEGFGLLERSGWMGVDLFFVLSGYLIGSQVLRSLKVDGRLNFLAFYGRRATRILPPFFVVLALYALLPAWRETPRMQPLWQFFTFTFNLLFDNSANYAFSHVWSLCVEEHFYLLFPLLALLLTRRLAAWKFITVCIAVVVGGMALRAGLWMHYMAPALKDGAPVGLPYLRYLYYPTYARLDGLVGGVALAACAVHRPAWMTA
jgi:peptidoglycan/LPS O-acetylase OafA/YrhL